MSQELFDIIVSCNNENGLLKGRFDSIHFRTPIGVAAEVECPPTVVREFWASGRLARVRLGRFLFVPVKVAQNYGNLYWNLYSVTHSVSYVRFVHALLSRGARCECITVPRHLEPDLSQWARLVCMTRRAAS